MIVGETEVPQTVVSLGAGWGQCVSSCLALDDCWHVHIVTTFFFFFFYLADRLLHVDVLFLPFKKLQ